MDLMAFNETQRGLLWTLMGCNGDIQSNEQQWRWGLPSGNLTELWKITIFTVMDKSSN
jgi:hypothetical protein